MTGLDCHARRLLVAVVFPIAVLGCVRKTSDTTIAQNRVPVNGGTFHMALEALDSLDPAFADDAYEGAFITQVFSGLLRADADLNVLPDIAQSWKISPDGLTYEFDLRQDAHFHNGRRITAQDFIYSFSRLLDSHRVPPGIIQDYLIIVDGATDFIDGRAGRIRGLLAPDDHTLIIRLAKPYPSFLSVLCMGRLVRNPSARARFALPAKTRRGPAFWWRIETTSEPPPIWTA
jgi:ABC-type transport system substrate-binding protein